jgi:L-seryl-tRNA(Ser) seleniumtransferase
MPDSLRRRLPAVHRLLTEPALQDALTRLPRPLVVDAIRRCLDDARQAFTDGAPLPDTPALIDRTLSALAPLGQSSLRRVINATGIVLNTNLGRAPLPPAALTALQEVAAGYSNLEFDLETGERGSRHSHPQAMLCALTGAEAALVVNNNAAAVLLVASAVAAGQEIVVSRGQLVEIGGSFRLPEVIAMSGAHLVEVGTTNRTHARDYVRAIGPETALLLRSHTSNYRIEGFTAEVSAAELAAIGREHGVLTCEDLGSGQLLDLTAFGLPEEPTVQDSVRAGLDLVTFSGDKLLGGPQAGIIVGRAEAIARLRQHPLLRALRPDKLTLAALTATLQLYLRPDVTEAVPTLQMLTAPAAVLAPAAAALRDALTAGSGDQATFTVEEAGSQAGGGSWPGVTLPTVAVTIRPVTMTAARLAKRLRQGRLPVIARVQDDRLWLDMRTLLPGDADMLPDLIAEALS